MRLTYITQRLSAGGDGGARVARTSIYAVPQTTSPIGRSVPPGEVQLPLGRRSVELRNEVSGRYVDRTIDGGVGHNLPQEAPAFAEAKVEVDGD